jgi:NAD-dependent dihydropyrimidine dehydrogenase PreA subunit
MEKVLIIDVDKCTGCRQCELSCSMQNYGEFNPRLAHIRIMKNKTMDIHLAVWGTGCVLCGKCVETCVPGALEFIDLDQAIIHWKAVRIGRMPAPLFGSGRETKEVRK